MELKVRRGPNGLETWVVGEDVDIWEVMRGIAVAYVPFLQPDDVSIGVQFQGLASRSLSAPLNSATLTVRDHQARSDQRCLRSPTERLLLIQYLSPCCHRGVHARHIMPYTRWRVRLR